MAKAKLKAKTEHPLRVINCQFAYSAVLFWGLAKNTSLLLSLFALSYLWVARADIR